MPLITLTKKFPCKREWIQIELTEATNNVKIDKGNKPGRPTQDLYLYFKEQKSKMHKDIVIFTVYKTILIYSNSVGS